MDKGGMGWTRIVLAVVAVWALIAAADWMSGVAERRVDVWLAVATAAVVMLAAFVSGIAGFAFSAVAGGALACLGIEPLTAVRTLVLCSIATQLYAVVKLRASIRWNRVWPMVAGGAATIPLGVRLLAHMDAALYAPALGTFLALYGCYTAVRRTPRVVRANVWQDAAAGALGGLAGGLAGLPGSIMTIWCSMRGWDKLRQRAVYQPYILAMQVATIGCLTWQAPAHVPLSQGLAFVPFALLGAFAGLALFQRMSGAQFHRAVCAVMIISGFALLARGLA